MCKYTIATLVYRSVEFAASVIESAFTHTRELRSGEAQFLFVLNDPTETLEWKFRHDLISEFPYRWVIQNNPIRSREWLEERGYGKPEYIHRVYRGWNRAIMEAHGDIVCLVNSDHRFSPDWFTNLVAPLPDWGLLCSQSVERPGRNFGGSFKCEFGDRPMVFEEQDFLKFASVNRSSEIRSGGVYMPCAFYRHEAIEAGLYPEGNLHNGSWDRIYRFGDAEFFHRMHETHSYEHRTVRNSIVYHFGEGEMRADNDA